MTTTDATTDATTNATTITTLGLRLTVCLHRLGIHKPSPELTFNYHSAELKIFIMSKNLPLSVFSPHSAIYITEINTKQSIIPKMPVLLLSSWASLMATVMTIILNDDFLNSCDMQYI